VRLYSAACHRASACRSAVLPSHAFKVCIHQVRGGLAHNHDLEVLGSVHDGSHVGVRTQHRERRSHVLNDITTCGRSARPARERTLRRRLVVPAMLRRATGSGSARHAAPIARGRPVAPGRAIDHGDSARRITLSTSRWTRTLPPPRARCAILILSFQAQPPGRCVLDVADAFDLHAHRVAGCRNLVCASCVYRISSSSSGTAAGRPPCLGVLVTGVPVGD